MRTLLATAGFATLALCSCAQHPEFNDRVPPAPAAGPPSIEVAPLAPAPVAVYAPPAAAPAAVPTERFVAKRSEVVRSIRNEATSTGLDVTQRDNAQGFVVVRYEGPATDYVDCGTYSIPAGAFRVPAAGAGITRTTASTSGAEKVEQDTHLSARLVAMVDRQGDDEAVARVEGQYVLRRDLVFVDHTGREVRRVREFIDLTTNEQASSSDGMVCIATGELERSILPKEEISFGS